MGTLTKKTKIAIAGGGAGLLILAVALALWQPWKEKPQEDITPPPQTQEEQTPPEEEGLSLTVGGEKVLCTLYEGDGWSIYVPQGWTVDDSQGNPTMLLPPQEGEESWLAVLREGDCAYTGDFVSIYPVAGEKTSYLTRLFYTGGPRGGWRLTCRAPEEDWAGVEKLMTALARTFTAGEDKPFSGLSPVAGQPDWQIAEGDTVLWMDKDGYTVGDQARKAVEERMLAWDNQRKENFTGKYRLGDLTWAGSYTCLPGREYVDVFSAPVSYEAAAGEPTLAEGQTLENGWVTGDRLHLTVFHDGGAVEETRALWYSEEMAGSPGFAGDLTAEPGQPSANP